MNYCDECEEWTEEDHCPSCYRLLKKEKEEIIEEEEDIDQEDLDWY